MESKISRLQMGTSYDQSRTCCASDRLRRFINPLAMELHQLVLTVYIAAADQKITGAGM
jgi:hypothetical protein